MDKKRILIVDDELIGRQLLEAILIREGFIIDMATNGSEALEYVRNTIPDLILLDIMMPEMNGYETITALKKNKQTGNIPIILITALDDRDSRIKGLEAGAIDYIAKPFDRIELLAKIKNNLVYQKVSETPEVENNEIIDLQKYYSVLTGEILSSFNDVTVFPFQIQPAFANILEKDCFRKLYLKTQQSEYIFFFGTDNLMISSDFYFSLLTIWALKLNIDDNTNTSYITEQLKNRLEQLKSFELQNPNIWFLIIKIKQKNLFEISGYNQSVLVIDSNIPDSSKAASYHAFEKTDKPQITIGSPSQIIFFSKNIKQAVPNNITIDYLKTEFIFTNHNLLEKTLTTISEKAGALSSFVVRIFL
jgi:CheY-like chemotaxis protein